MPLVILAILVLAGLKYFGIIAWSWWIVILGPIAAIVGVTIAYAILGGLLFIIFFAIFEMKIFKRTNGVGRRH